MLNLDLNVVFELINIIVLFLLLKKFLFGPVTDIMEKRENLIRNSVEEAANTKNEANELKAEYENRLSGAKEQAANIVKEAKARGDKEYELIVSNAQKDAQRLIAEAEKSAVTEKEKALKEAKEDIASLAILAATKIVEKNTDAADDKRLIDDFLSEVGEAN